MLYPYQIIRSSLTKKQVGQIAQFAFTYWRKNDHALDGTSATVMQYSWRIPVDRLRDGSPYGMGDQASIKNASIMGPVLLVDSGWPGDLTSLSNQGPVDLLRLSLGILRQNMEWRNCRKGVWVICVVDRTRPWVKLLWHSTLDVPDAWSKFDPISQKFLRM